MMNEHLNGQPRLQRGTEAANNAEHDATMPDDSFFGDAVESETTGHRPVSRLRIGDIWRERLLTKQLKTEDGEISVPTPIAANVATVLRFHPEWRQIVAWDAFREAVVTLKAPPWHPIDAPSKVVIGEWGDDDTARLVNWLARLESFNVTQQTVEAGLSVAAQTNVVHPVRDYLHGLKWDGVRRLDAMLPVYFGTEDTAYERGVGARWMISAVARAEQPGCQVDCTMLLEGPQGIGKTSAFRALVPQPEWYADSGIDLSNKDSFDALRAIWIYGLDELDSLRRGELTRWKNFLTATRDHYRPPYGRRARDFARQTVFCGTTNESEYFSDRTGNRRFLPVRVTRQIDVEAIRRDRDQLWGEAHNRYEAGEPWHVNTPEFRALCEAQQVERVQEDPWETFVARWLASPTAVETTIGPDGKPRTETSPYDDSEGVVTSDVLVYALNKRRGDISNADTQRCAGVLRTLGYQKGPLHREEGHRVRRYIRPSSPGSNLVTDLVTGPGDT